jgi:histidinol-phosphate aminotransferase
VGRPELVREIERARGPYTLNEAGEAAAVAALTEDLSWVRDRVAEAAANRERLAGIITAAGRYRVAPSATNFLLVTSLPGGLPILTVADRLRAQGIEVRRFEGLATFGDAIRITIGPWPVMERLIPFFEEA